ncbi:bifunctional diaminohydroxyphosphoribosylaminopyrimidine deaminase/5-amino-6-(5-phosphoribosylamino)uracil reductase RibD [Candidatus Amarobacter glycogenicus]|uniref:bifunctional diaminohydroxyphosphoribosylaminopyrimidine deaminase/5-amino-6-(5-phosphoribosylamino)uracil reductase RibD n=1 Tax=Candidatus Amarobacter glycogenicus TaxID=3140699 RepID=UPI002A1450F0|nr:bifunctional diaminohydroxyphosphoribosylaminopyrimidine deaminase/5-amino-6-(5-phosphoribosylamino)uracil reductase RibD [Dehalococcoidia bacterium]
MQASTFMQVAIDAARAVRGRTSPNPWVGAVVVRDGKVVSIGATAPYGGPHAEAAALAGVDARGATLYTTLEPCMPFEGKRTRPCAEAIIEAGVSRVVISLSDPHAPVRGQGAAFLRAQGVQVDLGDGSEAVTELLRPYLKFRQTGLPYVIAKFAMSLDGKVGAPSAGITWLTSEVAVARAHQDRAWVDAILVGSGTVLADDPALTAREAGSPVARQPLRVVLDGRGRTDPAARVLGPGALVVTSKSSPQWRRAVAATGAELLELDYREAGIDLRELLRALGQRDIVSLIAEGGPSVLASLFDGGHVDEVHAYVAPLILGQSGIPLVPSGPGPAPFALREVAIEPLPPDVLIRGYTGDWSP